MTRTWRPWLRLLALLALVGLVAAACGSDNDANGGAGATVTTLAGGVVAEQTQAEANYGGHLVVGLESESNAWTPGISSLTASGLTVANAVFDSLVSQTETGEYVPFLAESIEPNDDLTQWTVKLRDGVVFHDGSPLDAETVKWTYDHLLSVDGANTQSALETAGVTHLEVTGDLTVVYHLSSPNAVLPELLRGVVGHPVSRQAYEADPDGFASHPVGTGPFMVESWVRDDRVVLVRNPNWWFESESGDQLPYLDRIEFRPLPDEETRALSLESDDVQVMITARGSTAKRVLSLVENGDRFNAFTMVGNQSGSSILNTTKAPLDDLRIRRAIAMAGDGEAVAKVLGDDGLVPTSPGFFSQDSPWYSQAAADAYPGTAGRDLAGAQALIEEYRNDPERSDGRAVGDPIEVEYACLPDPSLLQVAQLQQSLWEEAGLSVTLKQVDESVHVANALGSADQDPPWSGDFEAACWKSPALVGDPLTDFQGFFGDPATSVTNFTNFTTPEILEALEVLRTSTDFDERYAAVEQIGIIAGQNVPIAFSSATPTVVGFRSDVHGIADWTLPDGTPGSGIPGGVMRFHQVFIATN